MWKQPNHKTEQVEGFMGVVALLQRQTSGSRRAACSCWATGEPHPPQECRSCLAADWRKGGNNVRQSITRWLLILYPNANNWEESSKSLWGFSSFSLWGSEASKAGSARSGERLMGRDGGEAGWQVNPLSRCAPNMLATAGLVPQDTCFMKSAEQKHELHLQQRVQAARWIKTFPLLVNFRKIILG